jgi:hypothetical protein
VNVVTRGLMAAGMAVYAAMHAFQAVGPPDGSPGWLRLAFAVATLAGAGLAAWLVLASPDHEEPAMLASAVLAGASLLALLAAYTVGFFGVREEALRAETAIVAVAEVVVLIAFAVERGAEQTAGRQVREGEPRP